MLLLGLEQQAQYRPELIEVHVTVYAALAAYITANFSSDWLWDRSIAEVVRFMPDTIMTEPELQALFDVLHGKDVDAIRPVLEAFAERHSGAVERIPPYKPIVFKAQRPARVVASRERSEATVQSPVSVAAHARSFADCLDGEGQDDVPAFLPLSELYQVAPLANQVDPAMGLTGKGRKPRHTHSKACSKANVAPPANPVTNSTPS